MLKEMAELKMQVAKAKDDKKRITDLEKKCRLLEEAAGKPTKKEKSKLISDA